MRLICYPTSGEPPRIIAAPVERDWMDRTPNGFAYRCLPLNIANAHGWLILNTVPCIAEWNGDAGFDGVSIRATGEGAMLASSHFGSGVLTFSVNGLFHTEPGYDLLATGPFNSPKRASTLTPPPAKPHSAPSGELLGPEKYPAIGQSWRRAWGEVVPFYAFPGDVRRILYTTNAIEALNAKLRRAVRARGHFPSDEAATKLLFLVLNRSEKEWIMPPREWSMAKSQFAVLFGERFTAAMD